jgi:DNA-directed RNA polymerase alpha subunit
MAIFRCDDIACLEIHGRILNALRASDINTIGDLTNCSESDLKGVTGLGSTGRLKCAVALEKRDLWLRPLSATEDAPRPSRSLQFEFDRWARQFEGDAAA